VVPIQEIRLLEFKDDGIESFADDLVNVRWLSYSVEQPPYCDLLRQLMIGRFVFLFFQGKHGAKSVWT
jgi:hypothetical protein